MQAQLQNILSPKEFCCVVEIVVINPFANDKTNISSMLLTTFGFTFMIDFETIVKPLSFGSALHFQLLIYFFALQFSLQPSPGKFYVLDLIMLIQSYSKATNC